MSVGVMDGPVGSNMQKWNIHRLVLCE